MVSLAIVMPNVIIIVQKQGARKQRVPRWAQRIFLERIAPFLGVKPPDGLTKWPDQSEYNQQSQQLHLIRVPFPIFRISAIL